MELAIYNIEGSKTTKKVKLNDDIFGIEPNDHAIYLDVKQILANRRQGTHDSKDRSRLSGSTKKLKNQKGSGAARYGDIKNPIFRGGGRVFGPNPRDYHFKLNKKVKRLARKSALSYKIKDEGIVIIEDLKMESPKTSKFATILMKLNLIDKRTLFVFDGADSNILKSTNNIPNVEVVDAHSVNTYDILRANTMVITKESVEKLEANF